MRAGELRSEVEIQRFTSTRNAFGEVIESWDTVMTVRALVEPLGGKEVVYGNVQLAEYTHKFTIRYQGIVKLTDRVIFDGEVFDIVHVANIKQRNRTMEILAKHKTI